MLQYDTMYMYCIKHIMFLMSADILSEFFLPKTHLGRVLGSLVTDVGHDLVPKLFADNTSRRSSGCQIYCLLLYV